MFEKVLEQAENFKKHSPVEYVSNQIKSRFTEKRSTELYGNNVKASLLMVAEESANYGNEKAEEE